MQSASSSSSSHALGYLLQQPAKKMPQKRRKELSLARSAMTKRACGENDFSSEDLTGTKKCSLESV